MCHLVRPWVVVHARQYPRAVAPPQRIPPRLPSLTTSRNGERAIMFRKRSLVLAATVGVVAAGIGVGTLPANALPSYCDGKLVTIGVPTPGNTNGTAGNDVVLISSNNASYNPVGGQDTICIQASGGSTIWAAGS